MQQFKIGDWVVEIHSKEIHQIIELFPDTCRVKKPLSGITYSTEYTDLKLWQPKEGEWCWFWNVGSTQYTLAKFKESFYDGRFTNYKTQEDTTYLYCAPFIGELPN